MNILLLHDGYRALDESTRLDFISKIMTCGCGITCYGPKEYEQNPKVAPIPYDERATARDIINMYNPDVMISYLHTPGCCDWFPKNICKVGVPTVIIEQDHYFYDKPEDKEVLDWYKEMDFSLVMRRHYYNEECTVPSVYTPPSADSDRFFRDDNTEKINKIGFAGSFGEDIEYYNIRRLAMGTLLHNKLLDENYGKIFEGYPEYLRSHVGMLSCSGGSLHTVLQKTFEIMLSGSVVLTTWMNCSDLLFDNTPIGFVYEDSCVDIVTIAKYIINEPDHLREVTNNAIKLVTEKHIDSVRIKEFYDIIKSLVEGKETYRIWGQ